MLFNSLAFLFGYAPIVIFTYFLIGKKYPGAAISWLGIASLVFYAWWYPPHTLLLLASIGINFMMALAIDRIGHSSANRRRQLFILSLALNLAVLCYFKYAFFFGTAFVSAIGLNTKIAAVALPLGISFFTFTQIAYLSDVYQRKAKETSFSKYLLFVTYFPHLVAGPVIHHKDVMTQFSCPGATRVNQVNVTIGIAMFTIGLFKKVFFADSVATFSDPIFSMAEAGVAVGMSGGWTGALAYTLQLYYDFSGYSDMAIGLSLMLNVRLPFNFNSPYKSRNIIDFWKRWHISLSTFLRDYLYIPLGGNRYGNTRRYINIIITMLLGGLWHGAGWNFILWGAMHGAYLSINHLWRYLVDRFALRLPKVLDIGYWLLTFLGVVFGWVLFRSTSFDSALHMMAAMIGLQGAGSWEIAQQAAAPIKISAALLWIVPLLGLALFAPNSQEIITRLIAKRDYLLESYVDGDVVVWDKVNIGWALALGAIAAVAIIHISRPTTFLYFNF